jgi:hypothetical protein
VIKLGNGRVLRLLQEQGREASNYYTYVGLLRGRQGARSFHLVNHSGGESSDVLMLDVQSGDSLRLAVTPVVSPDGARLLTYAADVNLCADPSSFAIWRITTGLPTREWSVDGACRRLPQWSVGEAVWRSADSISVVRLVPAGWTTADTSESGWAHTPVSLVRRTGGWQFDGYPDAAYCHDTSEAVALRCADSFTKRRGDTLVLSTSRQGHVVRVDNPADGENHSESRFHGRLRGAGYTAFHVIDHHGYESRAVELVNETTGESLMLAGFPLLAPNGVRFAVEAEGFDTCEGTVALEVWSLDTYMPTREFGVHPFDCGRDRGWWPTDVTWRGVDTLTFVRHQFDPKVARSNNPAMQTSPAMLVRLPGGWTLDSASAAAASAGP